MHKEKETKGIPKECSVNTTNISNLNSKDNAMVIDNNNSKINLFIPVPQHEADKRVSTEITQK